MNGKAQVLYADPPWLFNSNSNKNPGRNPRRHYKCMTDAELMEMPVGSWCEPDCLGLIWTTVPMLVRSLKVIEAWRFKYVSQVVWVKDRIGTGHWARNRHEILLICKRGKFPLPPKTPFADSVYKAPVREHSRKPDLFAEIIEDTWQEERKLELFGRANRRGWTVWGNEVGKFDE